MTAVVASEVDAGIRLEHVFDYVVSLKSPAVIGAVPGGTRLYYEAISGEQRSEGNHYRLLARGPADRSVVPAPTSGRVKHRQ